MYLLVTLVAAATFAVQPAKAANTISVVDDTSRVGESISLALGADGNPVIGYVDLETQQLKLAVCSDPGCASSVVRTIDSAEISGSYIREGAAVAVSPSGNPAVAYYEDANGKLKFAFCSDEACNSSTLTILEDRYVAPSSFFGAEVDLEFTKSGLPVVSYYYNEETSVRMARCLVLDCGSFEITTIDNPSFGTVGAGLSMVLDENDNPVVSVQNRHLRQLRIVSCGDNTCSPELREVVVIGGRSEGVVVGEHTSVTLDSNGNPRVSFYEEEMRALMLASCSDAACTSPAVQAVDMPLLLDVGHFASMALDQSANPVIAYYDATLGNLKLAACNNPDCAPSTEAGPRVSENTTIVDEPVTGDVGRGSSMAIGEDGNPVIAYLDTSNNSLKVAKCGNQRCTPV